jgi:hypothetical protein
MYTVYDFGDFDSSGKMGDPYVKILPLTNATAASITFHEARGGSPNLTISASGVDLAGNTVGTTNTDRIGENVDRLLGYLPALMGIMAFNSLVLLGLVGCVVFYFLRRRKGKRSSVSAKDHQYQRVRSQYDPKEAPPPLPLGATHDMSAMAAGTSSARASYVPEAAASRHSPSASIHSASKRSVRGPPEDEPFTPPQDAEHEGDLTNLSNNNLSLMVPDDASYSPLPSPEIVVSPEDGMVPTDLPPIPRPRAPSTASWMTQGRPHSLFSVSSNQGAMPRNRPASTYDTPLGAPRPRQMSGPSDRPESTFSNSPLIIPERRRTDSSMSEGDTMPRPRYMGSVDGLRPMSTFSVDSGAGAAPLRPVSRFIDASGARPLSEAQ